MSGNEGNYSMGAKKMIGEVLSDLGFVTRKQLKDALQLQRQMIEENVLPEKRERAQIVADARSSPEGGTTHLGEIMLRMGFVTKPQLDKALERKRSLDEKYGTLESDVLYQVMDLGTLVNSSLNLADVLSLIMKSANKLTCSCASTLMLLDERTGELVFSVPTGPKAQELVDVRLKKGYGIAGWVADHEQAVIVNDVKSDSRFYAGMDQNTGFETKSLVALPLKAKGKLIGVLEVINKEDNSPFTPKDELLLTIFGAQAAMAIENARLYGELKDQLDICVRMERDLASSEKFRALGQLSGGVAHDFNNILAAIIGYAEMTFHHLDDKERVKLCLEQILKASSRAKELVIQILAFSLQSKQEKKPVQCHLIVMESLKLLRATLPSTIEIRTDIAPDTGTIMADSTQIHQVLMNLFTNARHAIGEKGGNITLRLLPVNLGAAETAAHPGLRPGRYVKLVLTDDGCGMDAYTAKQVFEPYFTTKEKGVGTGMGLAMVHGIVKSHGGAITVTSAPGKGTTFEVLFPRIDLEAEEVDDSPQELPRGSEHILLVDDEDDLVYIGKEMLTFLGYKVTTKTNSGEALEAFQKDPGRYDLLITDMTMPGMNGDKLAVAMMKIKPVLPVIIVTGFSERFNLEKAKALGIRDLAMKPIVMRDLAATVRRVLNSQ
jgi:signal transduction histidine kinase